MKPTNHELEAISVRRAKVTDAGKVRYRVYSNPAEFVAVIADSALMAVKASGISKPYKIMRDLPTEGVAIEAERMAAREEQSEHVAFATSRTEKTSKLMVDLPEQDALPGEGFVPLGMSELQRQGEARLRILSPDMVNEIIENHAKQAQQAPAAVAPEVAHETVMVSPPEPEMSPEEKVTQLANEILPSAAEVPENAAQVDTENLSPEEVEKLLNG